MKTETIKKLLAEFKDLSRYPDDRIEIQGLKAVFEHLPDERMLDQQQVELLKTYLKNRWARLKKTIQWNVPHLDNRSAYLNMVYSGVDLFCITIAKTLAVPDRETKELSVSSNFYKLLMPGIENDFDITFTEPVWTMLCTQLLITEDRKFLIPIGNIYEYFAANKVMVNPLTIPPKRLTPSEIRQFEHLAKHKPFFRNYEAIKFAHDASTSWVTLTTIQKLKEVLDSYEDADRKIEDFEKATAAFDHFNFYVQSLLPEEQDALNRLPLDPTTAVQGQPTFGLLMADVNRGAECVTHHVRAKLARLVAQYISCNFRDENLNVTIRNASLTYKKALTADDTIPTPPPYERYCEPLKKAVNAAIEFHPQIKLAKLKKYHNHLELLNDQLQPLLDEKNQQQLKNVTTSEDKQSLLQLLRYLQSGLIFLKEGPLNQFYGSFLSIRRNHGNNESRTYKMVYEVYCQLANAIFSKYDLAKALKPGIDLAEKLNVVVSLLEGKKVAQLDGGSP